MGATATYGLAVARRTAVLAGLWVILVEGRPVDSFVGLPVAVALAFYSLRLSPAPSSRHPPMRLMPLLGLAPRLVRLSLAGGLDVALRALRRPPDLDPAMVVYPLTPPDSGVAIGLSVMLTLMPGTLAVVVAEDGILIHVLDRTQSMEAQLRPLEDGLRRGLGAPPRSGGEP